MADPIDDEVSKETRATETEDEQVKGGADRAPTDDEKAAAKRGAEASDDVAAAYDKANKTGAEVQGEGQID